jgi:hypothetical protein
MGMISTDDVGLNKSGREDTRAKVGYVVWIDESEQFKLR